MQFGSHHDLNISKHIFQNSKWFFSYYNNVRKSVRINLEQNSNYISMENHDLEHVSEHHPSQNSASAQQNVLNLVDKVTDTLVEGVVQNPSLIT